MWSIVRCPNLVNSVTLGWVQVQAYIHESCSREFEGPMLNDVIKVLTKMVVGWIWQVYG